MLMVRVDAHGLQQPELYPGARKPIAQLAQRGAETAAQLSAGSPAHHGARPGPAEEEGRQGVRELRSKATDCAALARQRFAEICRAGQRRLWILDLIFVACAVAYLALVYGFELVRWMSEEVVH